MPVIDQANRDQPRLQVLGPLEAYRNGALISLGGGRQKAVLGLLALHCGAVVSGDSITGVLWDGEPPGTAKTMIQACISRLRAALFAGADNGPLETVGHGYRLCEEAVELDVVNSRRLTDHARELLRAGEPGPACQTFGQALGLWHGRPLPDVPLLSSHPALVALEQEHAGMILEYAQVAIRYGWHEDVLPHLFALTEQAPLHEHAHAHLMLALAGSGQRAAALELYEKLRRRLAAELGVRPDTILAEAHARVLRGETPSAAHLRVVADSDSASAAVTPVLTEDPQTPEAMTPVAQHRGGTASFQLPPSIADFTGRHREAEWMRSSLQPSDGPDSGVPVVVVGGLPGVGKSTLMLHVAHSLRASFPDGQLWAALDGASARPRDPGDVLGEWLRALGVHGSGVPDSVHERATLFRSLVADRRVLVAVDDAGSASQVQPLLPGTAGCAVVVTSRRQLSDLPGARLLPLEPLPEPDATLMLSSIVGSARIAAERQAARELAAACGYLPLAIRIAGAKLAARPASPVSRLAEAVAAGLRGLDVLRAGDLSVTATIASGYQALHPEARRAFRALSLLGPCDVAEWVIGVLLDEADATPVVDELIDRSMLTAVGADVTGQNRYRLHDLLRKYAIEQAAADGQDAEQRSSQDRILQAWVQLSSLASARLPEEPFFPASRQGPLMGHVPDAVARAITARPLDWFGAERLNLLAATERACTVGRHDVAARLGIKQAAFQNLQVRYDDAARIWQAIAVAAGRAEDSQAVTYARLRLAAATVEQGYSARAMGMLDACVTDFEQQPDLRHLAFAIYWRSCCASDLDSYDLARRDAERGVQIAQAVGDSHAELSNLRSLGIALGRLEDHDGSIAACERALRLAEALPGESHTNYALHNLAFCCFMAGQLARALDLSRQRYTLCKQAGDLRGQALSTAVMGDVYHAQGHHREAVDSYAAAQSVFRAHFIRRYQAVCSYKLGCAYLALGERDLARQHAEESLPVSDDLGLSKLAQRAHRLLKDCGGPASASTCAC